MSKHTQGPWIEMSNDGYTFFIHSITAKEKDVPIARVLADQREGVDPESNARLIAAAPDLLGIAKLILKEWGAPTEGIQKGELIARLSQYAAEARAAIAKVEGT